MTSDLGIAALEEDVLATETVVGEYVIEALLGSGGFARVYRARHRTLGGLVAIKVLARALSYDPEAMRRFLREAQSASRIDHPGIVRAHGFGRLADQRAYQVMELVNGPSLDAVLSSRGRLPSSEAIALLAQIASALSAAHAAGIVHRDLKPSNILLATAPDGGLVARLTDFGIAKALEDEADPRLTRTGKTLGTPTYMSPEQALGGAITPASDIYSFGVVAFELLTGKVPFDGESAFAIMMKHVQDPRPLASHADPALGTRFDAILERLLDTTAANRPSLEEAMRVFAAEDHRPPARPRALRWVAIAALVVAAIGIVAWRGMEAREKLGAAPDDSSIVRPPPPPTSSPVPARPPPPAPDPVTPAPGPSSTAAPPDASIAPPASNRPVAPTSKSPKGTEVRTKRKALDDPDSFEAPSDYAP